GFEVVVPRQQLFRITAWGARRMPRRLDLYRPPYSFGGTVFKNIHTAPISSSVISFVRAQGMKGSGLNPPGRFPSRKARKKPSSVYLARPVGVRLAAGLNEGGVPGTGPPDRPGPWQPVHPLILAR